MADSSNVEAALVTMIRAAFYPSGTGSSSIIGSAVSVQRGWPTDEQATGATNSGATLITVHADKGMSRDATRYPRTWSGQAGVSQMSGSVNGTTISFSGTAALGNIIAVQYAGVWFLYVATANDTLTTIAAQFAASIAVIGISASGPVLTLPPYGDPPQVRVGMQGSASQEVARAQAAFRISVWAPTPVIRDAVMNVLPGVVAGSDRLTMPDGSVATWMGQQEAGSDDMPSRARMWRRDILTSYDWPVLNTQTAAPLMLLGIDLTTTDGLQIVQIGDVTMPTQIWSTAPGTLTDSYGNDLTDSYGNNLTTGANEPLLDEVGDLLGVV